MAGLQGHLLVASPYLADPNFHRTVVLMIHHGEDAAFGVVLNRLAEKTVQDLWAEVASTPCVSQGRVNIGGPVSGPLMAIHTNRSLGELEVLPGVYFSAQREHLEKLVRKPPSHLRLFIGHSGWAGGQLESELEQGSWLTLPATTELVFHDEVDLWKKVTQRVGREMLLSMLKIKHVPGDAELN